MAAVDASKGALRASLRPFELTSYFAFGAQSGALTGVAAKGPVFSLRNAAGIGELVLVRHVGLGFLTTIAFTTPQIVDARIATTAAFTAGTRTLDTNSLAQIGA